MKWFGRKAGRIARPFLFAGWTGATASAGDWPRSYEAQVREAYLQNPVAQRAVRLVADGLSGAPVYALGDKKGAERSQRLVGVPLLETVAAQLLLHGNAYIQILLDAEAEPAELFPLRPERVRVEADGAGWPAAFVYKAGESKMRLAARDGLGRPSVVHLKAMHPLDDHYGLGCLGAAAGAVAIHNAATRWNKALLDNAARPSGALVLESSDGAALSGEQFDRLAGQAQKELYHNEALAMLDAAVHPAVEAGPATAPPALPAEGQAWIVAEDALDPWTDRSGRIAFWTEGGWRYLEPQPGMTVWNKASGLWMHWTGAAWEEGVLPVREIRVNGVKVVGERQPEVASPSGGTVIDAEARAALESIIVALKSHGLVE